MSDRLSIKEAAAQLGLSRQLVHHWVRTGKLAGERSEGRVSWSVSAEAVQALLNSPELAKSHELRNRLAGKPKKAKSAYASGMQAGE